MQSLVLAGGRRARGVTSLTLLAVVAIGVGACGGSKSKTAKPLDPVTTALQAPGTRTVVIPKQSNALTVVVPPCGSAELEQETTKTPPGSNQVTVPESSLDQTVAVQPCMQGAKNAQGQNTVLLGPGGTGSPASEQSSQPQNQLILPKRSNLTKVLVPPCIVLSSSSSSSGSAGGSGGSNTVLPAARGKTTVTAPPCKVHMTSSSS
jgi:hypothetical protein